MKEKTCKQNYITVDVATENDNISRLFFSTVKKKCNRTQIIDKTRPDTRLPKSHAGGQQQCWRRSKEHLGRSSKLKNARKVTGPNTRPKPVADRWAGARMRIFTLNVIVFNSSMTTRAWRTDGLIDQLTDQQTDIAGFWVVEPTTKMGGGMLGNSKIAVNVCCRAQELSFEIVDINERLGVGAAWR